MLKRIFVTLAATVLAMGLVGGASATTVNISQGVPVSLDPGTTYVSNSGLIGGLIDPNDFGMDLNTFSHVYDFTLSADNIFNLAMEVGALNDPSEGEFGIANLTYTWTDVATGGVDFTQSVTVTDSDGASTVGAFTFNYISTYLAALTGDVMRLTVTGLATDTGGSYSLIISPVPLPAAALLFGSALLGGGLMRRRKMIKEFGLPV